MEELIKYFSKYKTKTYKSGEILINPDIIPTGIYLLEEGVVRMFSINKAGKEITVNTFRPISYFPVSLVILNKQDKYYYQALTNITVRVSPKEKFENFLTGSKKQMLNLMQRIYRGLEGYMLRMEAILGKDAYYNTLVHLVIYGKRFKDMHPAFYIKQNEIAMDSGLSRETVTRQINKLKKKNLLRYDKGKLIIADLPSLENELSQSS